MYIYLFIYIKLNVSTLHRRSYGESLLLVQHNGYSVEVDSVKTRHGVKTKQRV